MIGKFVPGEGPNGAYVFICGEAPGRMEASIGRPFCGISGQELNRYLLMQTGIRRQDCYITNVCKYRPDEENSDPSADDIARDEPYLLEEIASIKPKVIVPVGRVAAQYFLGRPVDMEYE
jgi:uracil-DNA glycosylase family 4